MISTQFSLSLKCRDERATCPTAGLASFFINITTVTAVQRQPHSKHRPRLQVATSRVKASFPAGTVTRKPSSVYVDCLILAEFFYLAVGCENDFPAKGRMKHVNRRYVTASGGLGISRIPFESVIHPSSPLYDYLIVLVSCIVRVRSRTMRV